MTAPDEPAVTEGQTIAGKYRVERVLGQGAMGYVVAALHQALNQRVAIKLLHPNAREDRVKRFLREARAAVRLKSEHVARVLDVGELPSGEPYMVMEYLEGNDLSEVLQKRGALDVAEAVEHVLHACEAIAEAHAAGIVHRDLKPANLFLTTAADGTASIKVLDFGISKAAPGDPDAFGLTGTSTVLGSPLYMSPEQMKSARNVDTRADIWSLGAILHELVTGQVPFNADSFAMLILAVNDDPVQPPSKIRPDIPPGLEAAIIKCLEKQPDERFGTVAELALAISEFGSAEARASAERVVRVIGNADLKAGRTSSSATLKPVTDPASRPSPKSAGSPSTKVVTTNAEPAAELASTALAEPRAATAPTQQRPASGAKGGPSWIAIAALVLVAAGVIYVLLLRGHAP